MRRARIIAALAVGTVTMLSIGPGSAAYGADRLKESGSHSGPARWSYSGPGGPGNWGSLSPGYRTCSGGRMQSPIDLAGAFPAKGPALKFDYRATPLKVVNTGHTVLVNSTPDSTLTVAGQVYELLQFHFHAPSEHAIAGARAPMEAHFVHRNAAGTLVVVGVTIRQGGHNPALAPIIAATPPEAGSSAATAGATIDPSALLPPDAGAYFHYSGSLTTPPCSERVRWFVLTKPVRASRDQIAAFGRVFGPNARPLQGRYGRLLIASP